MLKDFFKVLGDHIQHCQATWKACRPHQSDTPPYWFQLLPRETVKRSMNLINSMRVTSSHYLFMRNIVPFRWYWKWYLKVYPRWFTDRGLVVLLRLHQGFGSVCHSRGMQPTFLHHLPAGEVWDSCREKSDSFECWPYSIVTYLQQNFSTNFPQ